MAFGDIVQSKGVIGQEADIFLATDASQNNTIILIGYYRSYEGGFPGDITDATNNAVYGHALHIDTGDVNRQMIISFLPVDTAGPISLSFTGGWPYKSILLEVEGRLSASNITRSDFDLSVDTPGAVTVPTADVASGTLAIGGAIVSNNTRYYLPADSNWTGIFRNSGDALEGNIRLNALETIDYSGTIEGGSHTSHIVGFAIFSQETPPVSFTVTDSIGNPSGAVFGQTLTVTTSNWGAEDPTHVDITGPSSNVLTLPLTATATANEYTFTMPTISETEGTTVAGLLSGAGTIRVYTLDTTAPTLTSPTGTATAATTADISVSTNEANGVLYSLVTTSATATATAVKAGVSQAVSATGVQARSVTGLTASTTYYAHFVHVDAAGNESAVSTSAAFTTPA